MKEILHGARFLMAETAQSRLPDAQAEVSFVGRSNVGKSALLCALTNNWKLARVSKTPGATRAINVYEVRPGRWLVDLPGYGYAVGPARARNYWPEMISSYLAERPTMKRVYVLIDAEVGASAMDVELIGWLNEKQISYQLVGTKIDKIGRQKHATQRARIGAALGCDAGDMLWVSAKEGQGLSDVRHDILAKLGF